MPQPAPAEQEAAPRVDKTRARVVTAALALPAAMALALSASTSYRFAGDRLGITNLHERVMLCATVETAVIALTLHAWGARSKASAWLAYGLVAVQSIPAFEVSGGAGGVFRIAAGPVLLAVLLHKLLGLEGRFSGAASTGLLASAGREIRERLTASLGLGRRGADSAAIARSRAADRAVALASARRLTRRSAARLAAAIDTTRHGLSDADADAAEASIVTRVIRRRSVADLHTLDARYVWMTAGTGADGQNAATDRPRGGQADGQKSATKRPTARPRSGQDTATKVATFAAKHPDMPTPDMATKLGISERTVRRYRNATA
ncbi:MAG TPA: hypothetical protein VGX23_14190 [Actinocrinis sp.]|nr:hypothetical protein [Actinocrinis sp.]